MRTKLLAVALLAASTGLAQEPKPAAAAGQKVELKGTIEKIQVERGQGIPYLELRTDKGVRKVVLGSIRYLMEKNFNPKAGETAVVKGLLLETEVMAQSITLLASNTTLALRDDNGLPLWRGGKGRGASGGAGQGPPKQ